MPFIRYFGIVITERKGVLLNLPTSFMQKYEHLLGKSEAEEFFTALQGKPKKAFRLNSLKQPVRTKYSLGQAVPSIKNAFYGEVEGTDPEWVSGRVYSQDPAAMFPASLAPVKPGEQVLDLCAAPGGKSTALGEKLRGRGLLVANEISAKRMRALRENIERWGLTNVLLTNDSSEQLAKAFPAYFDLVLVDAPCSGEGMFRKNPAAVQYWSPAYVLTCQRRQKEILKQAVKMIKPGGKLVYSTCTFSPEEDEEVAAWLVEKYRFKLIKPAGVSQQIGHGHPEWSSSKLPALSTTLRFWPQDGLGEGQFVAIFDKPQTAVLAPANAKRAQKRRKNKLSLNRQQKKEVEAVLAPFNLPLSLQNWSETALVRHKHVFIPATAIASAHLHIINNGVELGILKKNRFEPGHQLAAVLDQMPQSRVIELPDQEAYFAYLHGETIKIAPKLKGFVLVSFRKMIFAFGKVTGQGILKNFYPKGLRTAKKEQKND